jgi:solute carrier family 6 amino acid transporter-like protein 5/7/9/14
VISSLDFLTSVISGVVIFSVLGQLKLEGGFDDISDVVKGGTGLAFIAYPDALSRLWLPQLWSVMFFFMLFLLGLDSEFALLETVLTVIYDGMPKTKKYKPLLVGSIAVCCFLLSLPCVSSSGSYVFQVNNTYKVLLDWFAQCFHTGYSSKY